MDFISALWCWCVMRSCWIDSRWSGQKRGVAMVYISQQAIHKASASTDYCNQLTHHRIALMIMGNIVTIDSSCGSLDYTVKHRGFDLYQTLLAHITATAIYVLICTIMLAAQTWYARLDDNSPTSCRLLPRRRAQCGIIHEFAIARSSWLFLGRPHPRLLT